MAIENRVKELDLVSKRRITYADLQFFQEEAHWPFDEFPALPLEEKIHASLDGKVFDFAQFVMKKEVIIYRTPGGKEPFTD